MIVGTSVCAWISMASRQAAPRLPCPRNDEKTAFGHAGCGANVVQHGGTVTFAADNFERSIQQSGFRAVRDGIWCVHSDLNILEK